MKNEEYIRRYKETQDKAYLQLLYFNVEKMLWKIKYEFNCDIDETYLGFMKAVKDYDETRGKFITFLYNVVKNEILQARRKKQLKTISIETPTTEDLTIGETLESDFDIEEMLSNKSTIEALMKHLTSTEKEIIRMYYYEDMTLNQIAIRLDMSQRQVQSRYQKAINKMKGVAYGN